MKKHYFIYVTTNLVNGKQYIGSHSTSNLKDSYIGSGKALKYALKKYGRKNFEFKILENIKEGDDPRIFERKWIAELNTLIPDGYNITSDGGPLVRRGMKLSEEHKRKISESSKGKHKEWVGRNHTEETKEKIRQGVTGFKMSEDAKKKISLARKGKKFPKNKKGASKEAPVQK